MNLKEEIMIAAGEAVTVNPAATEELLLALNYLSACKNPAKAAETYIGMRRLGIQLEGGADVGERLYGLSLVERIF